MILLKSKNKKNFKSRRDQISIRLEHADWKRSTMELQISKTKGIPKSCELIQMKKKNTLYSSAKQNIRKTEEFKN